MAVYQKSVLPANTVILAKFGIHFSKVEFSRRVAAVICANFKKNHDPDRFEIPPRCFLPKLALHSMGVLREKSAVYMDLIDFTFFVIDGTFL